MKPVEADLTLNQLRWLDAYDLMDDRARDEMLRVVERMAMLHPRRTQQGPTLFGGLPRVPGEIILKFLSSSPSASDRASG